MGNALPEKPIKEIGIRLKEARKELRLGQREFGEVLGLSWYQIKDIEGGRVRLTKTVVKLLYHEFGINSEWLLTGEGERFLSTGKELLEKESDVYDSETRMILDEMKFSPTLKDTFIKFIKAKRGDKQSFEDIQNVLKGLKIIFE